MAGWPEGGEGREGEEDRRERRWRQTEREQGWKEGGGGGEQGREGEGGGEEEVRDLGLGLREGFFENCWAAGFCKEATVSNFFFVVFK